MKFKIKRKKFLTILFFVAGIIIAASLFFAWKFIEGPKLVFSGEKIEQGDVLVVRLDGVWRAPAEARLGSKPVSFFRRGLSYFAIIGIDAKSKPEKIPFYVKLASGEELTSQLTILLGPVKKTKLVVSKEMTKQGIGAAALINNIISNDKPTLDSIFKIFTPKIGFSESFINPLKKWTDVGNFGTLRQSSGGSVRHFGVDLKADLGDSVFSINDGVAQFIGELPDYGKTVIIDHGLGIFSGYLHLSEIKTVVNSKVKRGEIIGLVGSTGYSLAPHLHFTVKINGASVNPRKFLDTVNEFIK
ncbi:MAG: M23 family metallopeptidase [Candidatus Azambacteria bacterium]|nr:M23 family metallopeptidase [Candidatus Azambacteria bacterium]